MPGIFAPLLARFARSSSARDRRIAVVGTPVEQRVRSRALAEAIDRAMDHGLWAHAGRIARSAARLTPYMPRLGCTLARLRLAEGDAETALAILDGAWACREKPAAARLLRAAALVQLGGHASAQADLAEWTKKRSAPLEARLMLAMLEWDSGDEHAAILQLLTNLRGLDNPRTLELLLLVAVSQNRMDQARNWVARLHQHAAFGVGTRWSTLLSCSLMLPPARGPVDANDTQVAALALELIAEPRAIPALVHAQRVRPERDTARLLAAAIEHALPELSDARAAWEAIAHLLVVAGERDAARQQAERGLALFPMSATLAHLATPPATPQAAPQAETDDTPDARPDVIATIGGTTGPQEKAA